MSIGESRVRPLPPSTPNAVRPDPTVTVADSDPTPQPIIESRTDETVPSDAPVSNKTVICRMPPALAVARDPDKRGGSGRRGIQGRYSPVLPTVTP